MYQDSFLLANVLLLQLLSIVGGQVPFGREPLVDPNEYLYLDPTENAPVIEFSMTEKGDFRRSTKPKMVEFYNPFCVSRDIMDFLL